jgi:hypothetical protein
MTVKHILFIADGVKFQQKQVRQSRVLCNLLATCLRLWLYEHSCAGCKLCRQTRRVLQETGHGKLA